MLEPHTYRANEQLAKTQLSTWRISQPHNVDHFQQEGFPVRISSIRELSQLLDTMQENRFAAYMKELGNLTESEFSILVDACRDAVQLQRIFLPHQPKVLPISTLLSAFTLYQKLLGADPNFRSVLEIGPGCGYLSFFLKRHSALRNYSQVEACESFYVLQNLVGIHSFANRFEEHAFLPAETSAANYFVSPRIELEVSPAVLPPHSSPLCDHYPWWRLGELAARTDTFDLVTSNANLLEFSASALDDYLNLLYRSLKPSGLFVVQCTGHEASGTLADLLRKLYEKGFALLFLSIKGQPIGFPEEPNDQSGSVLPANADLVVPKDGGVVFTTNNAVLIKAGHPLFDKYYKQENFRPGFVARESIVERMYFKRPDGRRAYSMSDFVRATEAILAMDA